MRQHWRGFPSAALKEFVSGLIEYEKRQPRPQLGVNSVPEEWFKLLGSMILNVDFTPVALHSSSTVLCKDIAPRTSPPAEVQRRLGALTALPPPPSPPPPDDQQPGRCSTTSSRRWMRRVDEAAPNENARPHRARPGGRSLTHSLDARSTSNAHLASDPARPDFSREVSAPQTPRSPFVHRARTRLRPRLPPSASSLVSCPNRLRSTPPPLRLHAPPISRACAPGPGLDSPAPLLSSEPGRTRSIHAAHTLPASCSEHPPRAPPTPRTRRPCRLRRDNACLDLSAQRASRRSARTDHLVPSAPPRRAQSRRSRKSGCVSRRRHACVDLEPSSRVASKLPRARARRQLNGGNVNDLKGIQNSPGLASIDSHCAPNPPPPDRGGTSHLHLACPSASLRPRWSFRRRVPASPRTRWPRIRKTPDWDRTLLSGSEKGVGRARWARAFNANAHPRRAQLGGRSRCVSVSHSVTHLQLRTAPPGRSNPQLASDPARPDFPIHPNRLSSATPAPAHPDRAAHTQPRRPHPTMTTPPSVRVFDRTIPTSPSCPTESPASALFDRARPHPGPAPTYLYRSSPANPATPSLRPAPPTLRTRRPSGRLGAICTETTPAAPSRDLNVPLWMELWRVPSMETVYGEGEGPEEEEDPALPRRIREARAGTGCGDSSQTGTVCRLS
ncbi:hypothetical protein B0H10DRAFT_2436243 [Mycena sp. CBHHK59/15]|nr:hypothetical protein B0H10DRAFT_2436243 [Mycena sp. CBHHK59/15]